MGYFTPAVGGEGKEEEGYYRVVFHRAIWQSGQAFHHRGTEAQGGLLQALRNNLFTELDGRFQFNHHLLLDNEVHLVSTVERQSLVYKCDWNLSLKNALPASSTRNTGIPRKLIRADLGPSVDALQLQNSRWERCEHLAD